MKFSELIYPLSIENFFRDYWGKQHLHLSGKISLLETITYDDVIKEIISSDFFKMKYIRSSGYQKLNEVAQVMKKEDQRYIYSKQELMDSMNNGRSIIVNHLQFLLNQDGPFLNLLYDFASVVNCPKERFQLACFITPENGQAFLPHIDNNETFTIQIQGTKKWRLYHFDDNYDRGKNSVKNNVFTEINMQVGDFLYVPRFLIHEVIATDCKTYSASGIFKATTQGEEILRKLDESVTYLYGQRKQFKMSYNPFNDKNLSINLEDLYKIQQLKS
ncbi:hypothetical protein AR687_24545 [Flavobacteriaceae bacterium CRH]|nr:hypothetical protein AR687_24545 [Flavobacteriaceae bacterium CRH]